MSLRDADESDVVHARLPEAYGPEDAGLLCPWCVALHRSHSTWPETSAGMNRGGEEGLSGLREAVLLSQ
ncbi:hypothetical protein [Streptomyces sp. NPDC058632]|uniref:hypothetical protein n=1 Tax=Streptomyces sp. NPDC058632 TaxID=3346567 RepID=UPI003659DA5F